MKFTGERFIPGADLGAEIQIEHFQRYQAITSLIKGKTVLDAASGAGYGCGIMAADASFVFGLEIDQETVTLARNNNQAQNINFCQGSIAQLPFPDHSIEVIVSFETIEHVDENVQELFIKEIKRVLTVNGTLLMSTPDKLIYSDQPKYQNEYHIKEFYRSEFESFLTPHFKHIVFFNQIALLSHLIYDESTTFLKRLASHDNKAQNGKYIIAICSDAQLSQEEQISSITIDPENQYQQKVDRVIELQGEIEGKNQDIKNVWDEVHKRDVTITEMAAIIESNEQQLSKNQHQTNKLQKQLEQLNSVSNYAEILKSDLLTCRKDLEHIHSTKAWKMIQVLYRIKKKAF